MITDIYKWTFNEEVTDSIRRVKGWMVTTCDFDTREMSYKLTHDMAMACTCYNHYPGDFIATTWFDPWVARSVYSTLETGGVRFPQDHPT